MRKDILVIIGFIILSVAIYLMYSTPKEVKKEIAYAFKNCKDASEDVKNVIEKLADYFNGIMYSYEFSLCVFKNKTAYCLNSNSITVMNYTIQFFDKICDTQYSFIKKKKYILIDFYFAKYIKNITEFEEGLKEGYVITNDEEIIKKLMES